MSTKLTVIQRTREAISMLSQRGNARIKEDALKKSLASSLLSNTYRGTYSSTAMVHYNDIYQPREKLTHKRRDQLAKDSAILRVVIDKITKEINRNGMKMKKIFIRKCMRDDIDPCINAAHTLLSEAGKDPIIEDCGFCEESNTPERTKYMPMGQEECGEEYQTDQVRCSECGFPTRPPKIEQKQVLRKILRKRINVFNQLFSQIVFHLGLDVEKHDNAFMISDFIYTYDKEYHIKPDHKVLINTYRGNPGIIRPVINKKTGSLGSIYFTCIKHRQTYELIDIHNLTTGVPRCIETFEVEGHEYSCNEPLQRATYVQTLDERSDADIRYAYIEGEVQHLKKYSPATPMGVSLIDSLYYILLQVIGQEKWIAEYYLKMRMFKGYLDVPRGMGGTADDISNKFGAEFKKFREDNWYIPIFTRPKDEKEGIKYNRIDDSPKDLQYIENRREARTQVANAYGVSNVWMDDTSSGAGMNNEGMGIVVTNRHVAFGQKVFEEQILIPYAASILNINLEEVEYYIGYETHEEQDLMAEKQRKQLDIGNAAAHQEIGGEVTQDENGDYILSSPMEGMPLIPMGQQGMSDPMQEVEGMSNDGLQYERRSASLPMQGSPSLPTTRGSNLAQKIKLLNDAKPHDNHPLSLKKNLEKCEEYYSFDSDWESDKQSDYYSFNYEYGDWEWKDDYQFIKFEDVMLNVLNIHPDYMINEEDVKNKSPRVREDTLNYYANETTEMSPLVVDQNYNLLDGHHRLYALIDKGQIYIRIAIVEAIDVTKGEEFEAKHPRGGGGEFATSEGEGKKPTDEEDEEDIDEEEEEEESDIKIPKSLDEDEHTRYRYYTAQDGYKRDKYSNTVSSGGKSQPVTIDLVKETLPQAYQQIDNIKSPKIQEFVTPQEFNAARSQYHDQLYAGYVSAGKALSSKYDNEFSEPLQLEVNKELWYPSNMNGLGDIIKNKEIGIHRMITIIDRNLALEMGDVAIKYRNPGGDFYMDPDPYLEKIYEDEQQNGQLLKMFPVPIDYIDEIWIDIDKLSADLKEKFKEYIKGQYAVIPISAVV